MDFAQLVSRKTDRFRELDAEVSAGSIYDDPRRAREILREHTRLKELLADWEKLQKARAELAENFEMAKGTDELAEMAQSEIPALEEQIAALQRSIQYALLPPDPNEDRDAILEIRAGTGGDEAGIFAGDLFRMYTRYAEVAGLKIEPMESSPADIGGFRGGIFRVSGAGGVCQLRHQSGGPRGGR